MFVVVVFVFAFVFLILIVDDVVVEVIFFCSCLQNKTNISHFIFSNIVKLQAVNPILI